jgi:hypothetical protein
MIVFVILVYLIIYWAKITGIRGYSWVKFRPIILFNLTFDILQVRNLTYLVFLDPSEFDILGWANFFYRYYGYSWIGVILLIFTGPHLEANLQNVL